MDARLSSSSHVILSQVSGIVLQSFRDPMMRDFSVVCDPVLHGRFLVPGTEYQAMFRYAKETGSVDAQDDSEAPSDIMMVESASGRLFAIRTSGRTLGVLAKHFNYDRRAPDFLVRQVVNRYTSDLARFAYHYLLAVQPVILSAQVILGPSHADDLYNMLVPWISIVKVLYQSLNFEDLEPLAKILAIEPGARDASHE